MRRGMQDVFACLRKILETGTAGGYNAYKAMLDAGHFNEAWRSLMRKLTETEKELVKKLRDIWDDKELFLRKEMGRLKAKQ